MINNTGNRKSRRGKDNHRDFEPERMERERGWGSWKKKLVAKISEHIELIFQHVEFEVIGKHPEDGGGTMETH